MKQKTIRVKIISCGNRPDGKTRWYSDIIGQEYDVENASGDKEYLIPYFDIDLPNIILKSDCEIIETQDQNNMPLSNFDNFKKMFDANFGKVTPAQFIKEMEALGYRFEDMESGKMNEFYVTENGECYLCHEATNSLAGDPSKWGIRLPYGNANGDTRLYHQGCVMNKL